MALFVSGEEERRWVFIFQFECINTMRKMSRGLLLFVRGTFDFWEMHSGDSKINVYSRLSRFVHTFLKASIYRREDFWSGKEFVSQLAVNARKHLDIGYR